MTVDDLSAIAYGGGVQSTGLVVLAAQGAIHFPVALFANVGEHAEHPATLSYVREIAIPWAAERGVEVIELHKTFRDGRVDDLFDTIMETGRQCIPVRTERTGMPMQRSCTRDWKVKVLGKWLREHGATKDKPATVAIGISTDEIERAGAKRDNPYEAVTYPLLDLRLTRSNCEQIIRDAGLPVPPKSACTFCPFHRPQVWAEQRRDEPELFDRAAGLERRMNKRRAESSLDPVYLTRFGKPLDEAIVEAQATLFDGPEGCDEGYCWT